MAFCTNCGRAVSEIREAQIKTLPKLDDRPAAPPVKKRNSKFWIGSLLGCLGLSALAAAGLIAAGIYAGSLKNANVSNPTTKSKEPEPATQSSPPNNQKSAETHLLEILDDRREAGQFRQMSAKTVPAKDYFPQALGAAQATYHNGSRYVSVSVGKYSEFELAKKDFEDQFADVEKKGGRTQVMAPAADGTIHGVYQYKGNSYAEYCTTSAFCYRLASTDAKALKTFIENFITL